VKHREFKEKRSDDSTIVEIVTGSQASNAAADSPLVQVDEDIDIRENNLSGEKLAPVPVELSKETTAKPLAAQQEVDDQQHSDNQQSTGAKAQSSALHSILLFARRLIALMIDQLILTCTFLFLFLSPLITLFYLNAIAPFAVPVPLQAVAFLIWLVFAGVALIFQIFAYCAKFESSHWQATPGKMLMGLRVVDYQKRSISYRGVVLRLIVQLAFNVLLVPLLVSLLVASLFSANNSKASSLEPMVSIFVIAACYIISLFTLRHQTLFDIFTRRIVESGPWSLRNQLKQQRLREAFDIIFGNRKKRDWPLVLCASGSAIALIPTILISLLSGYAISETNQAFRENPDNVRNNQHYLNAHRCFKNVDCIYYVLAGACDAHGDAATSEDVLRKAAIINPKNWLARGQYGLLLEAQGKAKDARRELAKMVELASAGTYFGEGEPWTTPTKESGPFQFGKYGTLSYGDLYLKLGRLSIQLGDYSQAVAYLDKAIEYGCTDSQIYSYRSSAYCALGNTKQAELDKKRSMLGH
jgi:uncharacterized RDD family membrane protein YckC